MERVARRVWVEHGIGRSGSSLRRVDLRREEDGGLDRLSKWSI